jgi:FKBP-type peptidyl-prolyl cis-trans isomerase
MTVEENQNGAEPNKENETQPVDMRVPVYVPGKTAVDVTPKGDGGVMKEILREGTGTVSPLMGDKVFVHYVGSLTDGTKFDSSRDRGEMFDFSLGKGAVIKAWDLGVATMKKGELAVLLCKSEYAYGAAGSPPKIPPNATLVFEVELFDWSGEDLSESKDGGIVRSQLVAGTGYQSPKEGASCKIHLIGRHEGHEFENREVDFVLGEGSEAGLVEGVEQAVKKFKKGERSRLKVKAEYAYGSQGHEGYGVPAGAELEYEVELKQFEKAKESWEMDTTEKFEQCEINKAKGTQFFKDGKYKIAERYYQKIIEYLKSEETLKDGEAETRGALQLAAHLNLAMCHLKLGHDLEASHASDEALKLDPNNEKGLYRRGTASLNLQNFEDALKDFQAVLAVDPQNKAAQHQIAVTTQRLKAVKEKERRTYAGMFSKFAAADAKKEQEHPTEESKPANKETNEPKPASMETDQVKQTEGDTEAMSSEA